MRTLLTLALAAVTLLAQDAPAPAKKVAPAPAEDENVLLSTALRAYAGADDLVVQANIKHEPPEGGGAFGGMGGNVTIKTSGMGADPFEGRVEAWRAADGSRVFVSESKLPGFELYVADGRTVERVTVEDEKFSLGQIKAELDAMLDQASFTRRLLDAKLKPTRDATTGKVTFQGAVSKDIVHPVIGDGGFNASRVLKVAARLVVTPNGTLERVELKITRNDPIQEMMRGGGKMRAIRIKLGGAGIPLPDPPKDSDQKHDIEGGSTTYTLTFDRKLPSERTQAFKRDAVRLIAGK